MDDCASKLKIRQYRKIMQNSGKIGKNREKSGKFRKNRENSGKFGKNRENSVNSGKFGKNRGRTGEPKISPKNRKFCQKRTVEEPGNGAKLAQNAILSNFDVESGNLSVSAPFLWLFLCFFFAVFVLLARFCRIFTSLGNFHGFQEILDENADRNAE